MIGGFGLFTEGSTLFSIGNLSPLFAVAWPECWGTHKTCDVRWVHSIEYLEIAGIIVGQVLVGVEGDWVGRKFGLVQDALISQSPVILELHKSFELLLTRTRSFDPPVFLGLVMLTAGWGTTLQGWIVSQPRQLALLRVFELTFLALSSFQICYAISLFIYGIGVGGEYPMTSTSSLESRAGVSAEVMSDDRLHRGRNVALAFLMQGVSQTSSGLPPLQLRQ